MACMCHVILKLWSLYFERKENNTGSWCLVESMILKILASRKGKGTFGNSYITRTAWNRVMYQEQFSRLCAGFNYDVEST